jgi:hypothetical protein
MASLARLPTILYVRCLRALQGMPIYRRMARATPRRILVRAANAADRPFLQGWRPGDDAPPTTTEGAEVREFIAILRRRRVGGLQLVRHPAAHAPFLGFWIHGLYYHPPSAARASEKPCCAGQSPRSGGWEESRFPSPWEKATTRRWACMRNLDFSLHLIRPGKPRWGKARPRAMTDACSSSNVSRP